MKGLYMDNYEPYKELVINNYQNVYTKNLNKNNINFHYNSILNIAKDCVEQEQFKRALVHVYFTDNEDAEMSIIDYMYNLTFWTLAVNIDKPISSYYLFYTEDIPGRALKEYIDSKFIEDNRNSLPAKFMNNLIYDTIHKFKVIDEFSLYLANTTNLEDTIELMNKNKEVYDIIHLDVSKVPLDMVKNVGMEATYRLKNIIMHSNHCQRDYFRSDEGLNIKQYKEVTVNEGTKPNGTGGAFPFPINKNLLTGAGTDYPSWYIEENVGNLSQLITYNNVSDSGAFASLLGLNNIDSFFKSNTEPCNTSNYLPIVLEDMDMYKKFETGRYFSFTPNGMEYKISKKGIVETETIAHRKIPVSEVLGKLIYLRSPMTCASFASGEGICYKCYGDLAHTNNNINPGKIAAEELTSKLTQKMLSAKHLLESCIRVIKWCKYFKDFFTVDGNAVKIKKDISLKNLVLIIDSEEIDDDDYSMESISNNEYNEYVNSFDVSDSKTNETFNIFALKKKLFLTEDLNDVIREKGKKWDEDSKLFIPFNEIKDIPLFRIEILNIDLVNTLYSIKDIINNQGTLKALTLDSWLPTLLKEMIKGNLNVSSIHAEVVLANQIRSLEDAFSKPQWKYPNEKCKLLTLNQALSQNPSISVSLLYHNIARQLYNPLTFKKNAPSFMDLFFMTQPQQYMNNKHIVNPGQSKIYRNPDDSVNLFTPITDDD